MTPSESNRLPLRLAAMIILAAGLGAAAGAWGAVSLSGPPVGAEQAASESSIADALPADDAAGEDLADLPRYPGAVRLEYRVDAQGEWEVTEIEYVADAPMDEVRTFYRDAMVAHGWSLAELEYGLGEWVFHLASDERVAVIELEPRQELVEIELELRVPDPASPAP